MDNMSLRDVKESDLDIFFENQRDEDASYMAAFTSEDPSDKEAYMAHWVKIRNRETVTIQTILFDGAIVGNVSSFEQFGKPSIGYWIGKEFWGKGLATHAVSLFLEQLTTGPLYARVAKDNIGSIRVLEKNGFKVIGEDKGFAHARGKETEEFILELVP